jgi:two-component system, LytTR family, sensor kinase
MRKNNCEIGFNDRLVMFVTIPLSALLIPIIFMGRRFGRQPYFTWQVYISTIITTAVIWVGNRYIMVWARRKFTQFEDTRKRLFYQSLTMLLFTILITNTLGFLLKDYCGLMTSTDINIRISDIVFSSNAAALFCTLTVVAIYENVYFMQQLRKSVEEKEMFKRESLNAQLNALKTQVNPHFLFNNLNTLSSLIPENPKHAIDFVQQLSKVYRHILEVKDEKSILLKDELDVLNAYAFLLKTRFDKNLQVTIDIAPEKLLNKIVPLALQILMENAIKHNIVSSDKPLHIDVFTENGSLVVSNNLQIKKQVNESTGIGLDNIRNRYKLISEKPVKVTENETNFTVSIPLINS